MRAPLLLLRDHLVRSALAAMHDPAPWPVPQVPRAVRARSLRLAVGAARLGSEHAAAEMQAAERQLALRFPLIVADMRAYAQQVQDGLRAVSADIYERLQDVILDGLAAGWTDQEIEAELRMEALGRPSQYARTWARTETTRYYTTGRAQQIEAGGDYVWGYEYVVIEDGHTSDICRALVGKRVPKEEMKAYPPFHRNCRTTVMAVMAERISGEPEQPAGTTVPRGWLPEPGWGTAPDALPAARRQRGLASPE